jgi:hypothetical protein
VGIFIALYLMFGGGNDDSLTIDGVRFDRGQFDAFMQGRAPDAYNQYEQQLPCSCTTRRSRRAGSSSSSRWAVDSKGRGPRC